MQTVPSPFHISAAPGHRGRPVRRWWGSGSPLSLAPPAAFGAGIVVSRGRSLSQVTAWALSRVPPNPTGHLGTLDCIQPNQVCWVTEER